MLYITLNITVFGVIMRLLHYFHYRLDTNFSFLLIYFLRVIPSLHTSCWHIPYVTLGAELPPGGV